jgi:hypothetical protein
LLEGERAQMAFTDPPYNVKIEGHVSGLGSVKHREFAMTSGEMIEAECTGFFAVVFGCLAEVSVDGNAGADYRGEFAIQRQKRLDQLAAIRQSQKQGNVRSPCAGG